MRFIRAMRSHAFGAAISTVFWFADSYRFRVGDDVPKKAFPIDCLVLHIFPMVFGLLPLWYYVFQYIFEAI